LEVVDDGPEELLHPEDEEFVLLSPCLSVDIEPFGAMCFLVGEEEQASVPPFIRVAADDEEVVLLERFVEES